MQATRRHHAGLGIAYMLAATVLFSLCDALGKWLTAAYPIVQVAWIRSLFGVALIGGFALATGRAAQLLSSRPAWHLLRGLLSAYMILGIFYGLKHIPLAEFTALIFSAPFIVALLSRRLLGEQVPGHAWIAIAVGFVGVLLIFRPLPGHLHPAHVTTLLLAVSLAFLVVTARVLSTTESAVALNFYLYPVIALGATYPALAVWAAPTPLDWLLFATHGAAATVGLGFFIQALRHARPAVVAPFDYVRLVWMSLVGYFIWAETPAPLTWIGIVLILVSGIYLVRHGAAVPELGADAAESSQKD